MENFNFLFDKAFLDVQNEVILVELCKKNEVISKDIFGEPVKYDGMPLRGVQKLLRNLVLFENIDFSSSYVDCSQLIERGLIPEKNICCSNSEPDSECVSQAVSIMSAYKSDIIRQVVQLYKNDLLGLQNSDNPNREFWKERESKSIKKICISKNLYLDLNKDYYKIIQNMDMLFAPGVPNNVDKFLFDLFCGDAVSILFQIRGSLAYAFEANKDNNSVYITDRLNYLQGKQIDKDANNIYALVKSGLPSDVNILPMPTTLEDVWRMRSHPAIKTFRKVLSEWNYYIQTDEFGAARKMEKDIIKANQGLEKIGKYKKLVSSPYVRTGLFIAGFIPVLSNIVNIYSYAEPHILTFAESKYSWTHIND